MAAGMHRTGVDGPVFKTFRLLYGQGIKVRPERNTAGGVGPLDLCNDPVLAAFPVLNSGLIQLRTYIFPGLFFVKGQAGVLVDISAEFNGIYYFV